MEPLLTAKQRLRIQTRHKASIEQYGYQPQALFWSSREIQQIRFHKLCEILSIKQNQQACSVLDVGCGFGDLNTYLQQQGFDVDYLGIDLSEDMVQSARFQHPGIQVQTGDLFDLNPAAESYDYVFLSGALNEVVETDIEGTAEHKGRYAKAVIAQMYRTCRKGVAFNLLDGRHPWVQSRPDLQSFLPNEIVEYCQSFAHRVSWVDGYLDNDFTVYLYKS